MKVTSDTLSEGLPISLRNRKPVFGVLADQAKEGEEVILGSEREKVPNPRHITPKVQETYDPKLCHNTDAIVCGVEMDSFRIYRGDNMFYAGCAEPSCGDVNVVHVAYDGQP